MDRFLRVTDRFFVARQISPDDLVAAAALGIRLAVNNRPEGESLDQPASDELRRAAQAAGIGYVEIPVRGYPAPDQAIAMHEALAGADGPALAWCLSGTRSIFTWAMGEALAGMRTPSELVGLARAAGYDVSALFSG